MWQDNYVAPHCRVYVPPDEGKIMFGEREVQDIPPTFKRNIGMVFQNYALWPHMTVYKNVAYGLQIQKKNPNRSGPE